MVQHVFIYIAPAAWLVRMSVGMVGSDFIILKHRTPRKFLSGEHYIQGVTEKTLVSVQRLITDISLQLSFSVQRIFRFPCFPLYIQLHIPHILNRS